MLDEPGGGLTHGERIVLGAHPRVRDQFELTVLLVEHQMGLVMGMGAHLVVLHLGKKMAEGKPERDQSHPAVISAYLGRPRDRPPAARGAGRLRSERRTARMMSTSSTARSW